MKKILVDAVNAFVNKNGEIDVKLHNLLEQYSNQKIILTNAPYEKFQQFGLNNVPYDVFTLEKNPTKLDPQYFEIFLNRNNLKPDKVVYFEHNPDAVLSARKVGITSHHFNHERRDLNVLREFLENNL